MIFHSATQTSTLATTDGVKHSEFFRSPAVFFEFCLTIRTATCPALCYSTNNIEYYWTLLEPKSWHRSRKDPLAIGMSISLSGEFAIDTFRQIKADKTKLFGHWESKISNIRLRVFRLNFWEYTYDPWTKNSLWEPTFKKLTGLH